MKDVEIADANIPGIFGHTTYSFAIYGGNGGNKRSAHQPVLKVHFVLSWDFSLRT